MAKFSRRTIRMLGDELSGWWVLATIADRFDDAGMAFGPEEAANNVSGQRRGLMMQYISTLDLNFPADTLKLIAVVNHVLFELVHRQYDFDTGVEWRQKFLDQIKRDGFVLDAGAGGPPCRALAWLLSGCRWDWSLPTSWLDGHPVRSARAVGDRLLGIRVRSVLMRMTGAGGVCPAR